MRDIWKVTSSELLTKQAMRKKYYIKNTYIIKLFLNGITARIEALVFRGTSFCMPVSKKSATHELSNVFIPFISPHYC
jgi:hypothetical protein